MTVNLWLSGFNASLKAIFRSKTSVMTLQACSVAKPLQHPANGSSLTLVGALSGYEVRAL